MVRAVKNSFILFIAMGLFISFSGQANAQSNQDVNKLLEPFPKASEGMVRHVIEMSPKADEMMYKVEIIPGKMMNVDCNRHFLSGNLEDKNLEGWGYNYYVFSSNGESMSTLMACGDTTEDKFVTAKSLIVRYNSRLPIVVYAPQGYEIRYRIWEAGQEQNSEEK